MEWLWLRDLVSLKPKLITSKVKQGFLELTPKPEMIGWTLQFPFMENNKIWIIHFPPIKPYQQKGTRIPKRISMMMKSLKWRLMPSRRQSSPSKGLILTVLGLSVSNRTGQYLQGNNLDSKSEPKNMNYDFFLHTTKSIILHKFTKVSSLEHTT